MDFDNIPLEMRSYRQWLVWRYEDLESAKPTKVPYSAITGKLASVVDNSDWASYDQAVAAMSTDWYNGIGFVLADSDPYCIIDLDDTNGNQIDFDRQQEVYNEFQTYAELSPSGKGLHIILKGSLQSGRKRSHIEIYSSQRYMTMTGNVYRNLPINNQNEAANILWERLGQGKNAALFYAGLEAAKQTDEKIIEIASTAANREKFNDLYYEGNWQKYYPSQSEADFALFDIIAFYSENGMQTQRIFLQSRLAEREKSRAQYRLGYMLNRCFDRMLPPVDIDGLRNQINEILEAKRREQLPPASEVSEPQKPTSFVTPELPKSSNDIYSVPPGLVGEIAQFIYAQAPRPVPEIALAGALGLIAGIVGRAYNVSGTGLNQYVLLLAPTGTGKEAIAGGIDKLMNAVIRTVPASVDFIGPGEIASAQALIKYMAKTANSFVSLVGEFGLYLQQMASVNAAPHLMGLRRMLLDLYNKSGEGKILRPSIYSDREKNTASVLAPAFTILGESTPEKFYEGLHEGMISEGLLPRFTMIEYHGERPDLNPLHMLAQPSFELIDKLSTICAHALMLNSQHKAIQVQFSAEAKEMFDNFDKHCDLNIRSSEREVSRHLWNRAHMKAMKLAAVVAVGCNPYDPVIDLSNATWATNLIVADVRNLLSKFAAGEIGIDNDETKQLSKIIATVKDYLMLPWSEIVKYTGEGMANLHNERIIPYGYLQRRLAAVAVFRKDRLGSSLSIKRAIKTLIERGDIQEVSRSTMSKDYSSSAVCYMVSNARIFT